MKQKMSHRFSFRLRRVLSGVLCALMLCGMLPEGISLSGSAQAAEAALSWSSDDLQTLHDYGIMRGDENGNMMPDKSVTRAEFVAMVNRSLGYNEKAAKFPFRDVASTDWFADDVSISYNMGYFTGTTNSTASPYITLTREQALVALGRNLMLQPTVGEPLSFANTRSFGNWSRGYVDPAVEAGIIDADPTGDFSPQKIITRGELAGMVARALGTRISTSGVRSLGTVDGNVTITTSNVTLRNTTINGDLYLTGGIGLGDVHLDNVTVNGKIVDAGAGQSEKGDISVVLNNVTADELVVDSMRDQVISLRTSGRTSIPKASVRTSASLDDSTSVGYGLDLIEIDGEEKIAVTLSGNIKEVHNKTPNSSLNIGNGVADTVTVDELAAGSTVTLGKDARIKTLNLDAGIKVTGSGYLDSLNISANGANVTLPQMPDEIVIAPGITATINRQNMDTAAAVEASSRPRLMSGYPVLSDVAPTTATALFMTNKPGTIYWAVTALADGSPNEDDIISPPSYAKTILRSGKIQAKASNTEYTAKISGLTSDGSYYLSAIVVDDKNTRSNLKVTAFTTPDNTTPAFAKGYPVEHEISEQNAQFAVMTTKSCELYYALLPKGSTAPRAADFKSGSISGNLGYGSVKMEKNNPAYIFVNDVSLEEQKPYVLYLWLTDFDGAKSSAVKSINFTTQDKTNPIVSNLRQTDTKATSSTLSYSLSEQGTLYWAVVATGNETFMSPSSTTVTGVPFLQTQEAKERVVSGVGALKKGSSAVSAAKAGADIGFTVSGLNSKSTGTSAYDLYYVAKDKAGNWSDTVTKITIYTLDTNAPKVVLNFTSFNEGEDETTKEPLGDTDVKLVFSKAVRVVDKDASGVSREYPFLDLYQQGKFTELADALRKHVLLYKVPTSGSPYKAQDEKDNPGGYDIDYSKARVYMDGTNMVLEFPYDSDSTQSAHHLANGGEYYFELSGIQDTTSNHNPMAKTKLPFKVKQAQINISPITVTGGEINSYPIDFAFRFDPKATNSSPDGVCYDIMLWSDTSMTVNLFRRENNGTWQMIGNGSDQKGAFEFTVPRNDKRYSSIAGVTKVGNKLTFNELKTLDENTVYEYAVSIVSFGGVIDRKMWNINANLEVTVASGTAADLQRVASTNGNPSNWESATHATNGRVDSIGNPDPYTRPVIITDSVAPVPSGSFPSFDMRDTSGTISMMLDRPGTIYWIVSKLNYDKNKDDPDDPTKDTITGDGHVNVTFAQGDSFANVPAPPLATPWKGAATGTLNVPSPDAEDLISNQPTPIPHELFSGTTSFDRIAATIELNDLDADCWYAVYMMFEGTAISDQAYCYKFKTHAAYEPILTLSTEGTTKAGMVKATVQESSANVNARLIPVSSLANTFFNTKFASLGSYYPDGSVPTEVNSLTILNAMMTSSGTEDKSLFDEYASDTLKNYVATLIKSGGSSDGTGSIATEQATIPMGSSREMSFSGLSENSEYFCVAVAENTSDATKRGFRAIRPVQVVNTTPPEVSGVGNSISVSYQEYDKTNHRTVYKVSGELTITYTNFLYWRDTTQTARPFTQGGTDAHQANAFFLSGGKTWAGVKCGVSVDSKFEVKPDGSPVVETQRLKLTVDETLYVPDIITTAENGDLIYTPSAVLPEFSGSFVCPHFCNLNGVVPSTNPYTVTYTNVNKGTTGATVTVTYSNK